MELNSQPPPGVLTPIREYVCIFLNYFYLYAHVRQSTRTEFRYNERGKRRAESFKTFLPFYKA